MHNNYYFFRSLVNALRPKLVGSFLTSCFSQNKDELILEFQQTERKPFYIKASLKPEFTCLSFPSEFARTKKNSVNLFPKFVNLQLTEITLFENERSFSLNFNNELDLLFKMHGNRANIIAFENQTAFKLFKNNFPNDLELTFKELHRPLEQSKEAFIEAEGNYMKVFPTFGKLIKKYLKEIGYNSKSQDEQWEIINLLDQDLRNPNNFYTSIYQDDIYFSLIKIGEIVREHNDPIEAVTQFYYYYSKEYFVQKEKQTLLKNLEKKRNQSINYIKKSSEKLDDIKNKPGYNQLADIIMANMHQIPERAEKVELFNFYTNEMITISLKANLSPQKNAENLYRKSKNQQIEIDQIEASVKQKKLELDKIEEEIELINSTDDVKGIKKLSKRNKPEKRLQVEERVPYKRFETEGFTILVGKGARENDELTLKYAKKDDLWLHAKDVTGSHVVLKHQSNKPFPSQVIDKAAQLAAFYSKRKTDSLCPVIVTPKKYIRKPKGLPPGMVHVDKEETILVSPEQWWLG
ncbi:NFACT family protein [Marivirga atlantica]|jgi:predicted ribosome quality control (RQC) complex YloA/Tae2 family protein|uniref:DUF814 domain-containing protein n=1 Tax=Marivirga atlantica TaxID=1548457 RepID=A0A937AIE1_9BACT|nr:NFACT RNA binding domain-containing protein [Marivirga atlantica]MBL0766104.1 DUF814 domain-containing protein [Marivirga atlantica]